MAIRQKTVVTMKMNGVCRSHSRTDISVRDVSLTTDEPEARGGTNKGPSPTETLVAALIGCTNVIAHKCAEANGVQIEDMSVDAEYTFDRRGTMLAEEIDIPFPEVNLNINVTTKADNAAIEKVRADLQKYCPVTKVFQQAGSRVSANWTITRP